MKKKVSIEIPNHIFAFVVFIDPSYSSGWTAREAVPDNNDIIHVGAGQLIAETDDSITLALFTGLFDGDNTGDVLNPMHIHKNLIIVFDKFTWGDYYNGIRRSKKIQKCINKEISAFCKEKC